MLPLMFNHLVFLRCSEIPGNFWNSVVTSIIVSRILLQGNPSSLGREKAKIGEKMHVLEKKAYILFKMC